MSRAAPRRRIDRRRAAPPPRRFGRLALAGSAGATVLAGVGLVSLFAGGYAASALRAAGAAGEALALRGGFAVERVTARGLARTERAEVLDALGVEVGRSILHVDLEAARARIEALGWVRAAAVSRLLPDTLHVSVREREPAAVWQIDFALKLIDSEGAVIAPVGAADYPGLPMIVGAGAPEAAAGLLGALTRAPALAGSVSALVRVGERRWDLRLRNGVVVKLPEAGVAEAVSALDALEAAHGLLDEKIEYLDLRDPDRAIVRMRGESADRLFAPRGEPAGGGAATL